MMVCKCFVISYVSFSLFCMCLVPTISADCPEEFEEMCECGRVPYGPNKKLTYVTNCTNAGFDNANMLRKLPPETEILIFVGNEIKDLPLNIFGLDVIYKNLRIIDFSDNHIQTIKGRTFHNVGNVNKLILNDNDLYIVYKDRHPRMFSNFASLTELHLRNAFTEKVAAGEYLNNLVHIFGNSTLKNLRVLNLENNEILSLSENEFCSLPELEEICLADNHLHDLNMNFTCLPKLKKLDVGNNAITNLNDQTISKLEKLQNFQLNLTNNPFVCDCNMVKTYEWLITTLVKLIDRESYLCHDGFSSNVGKRLVAISLDDLRCTVSATRVEYHSPAYLILVIGLVCLTVLISVLIYRNKRTVGNFLNRIAEPIRNKFQYMSLDRTEGTMTV